MKRDRTTTFSQRALRVGMLAVLSSCTATTAQVTEEATDAHTAGGSHWNRWVASQEAFPVGAWILPAVEEALPEAIRQRYLDAGLTLAPAPIGLHDSQKNNTVTSTLVWARGEEVSAEEIFSNIVALPGIQKSAVAFLGQELEPASFDALGATHQAIYQSSGPEAILPLGSLFPNWFLHFGRQNMTYERYVEHYINRAHPAALMTTHFPLLGNGTDRVWFYDNLETLRRQSLDAGIGLIGQVQCVGHGDRYRVPSASDIRWQVNSYIAYGAKGIWYYYFSMDSDQPGDGIFTGIGWYPKHFTGASPDPGFGVYQASDEPTRYDTVRDINSHLHAIWPVLKRLTSVGVYHTDSKPPVGTTGIQHNTSQPTWTLLGESLLVGVFEDNETAPVKAVYLYIVNKQHGDETQGAAMNSASRLLLAEGYRARWIGQESIAPEISNGNASYSLSLPGGAGVLLRLIPPAAQ